MNPAVVSPTRGVLSGALFGVLAVALRASLQPVLADQLPFAIAFPATVVSAVLWGTGAGSVTAMICALAVLAPGIPPNLPPVNQPMQMATFLVGGILIALFCGRLRSSRAPGLANATEQGFETPLTSWLRTVLWGALLVPGTAFLLIAWWGYQRAVGDATANVVHACDLMYEHAQKAFAVTSGIAVRADVAAAGPDAAVRRREAEVHQRFADMTSSVPSVINLNVWDASGTPLARSDFFPVDPTWSVADRAYFIQQRDHPQPLGISDVIKGRQTGLELFNATMRRASPDGRFNGVVSVSIAPSYFRDYYQSLATEQPNLATFGLIRTDGEIIARWPRASGGRTRTPADSPVLARVAGGERAGTLTITLPGADTEPRITRFRRLDPYPLYVVTGVSRQAMLVGWARFVALLAAILLPTSAGLGYVTWVALKKTRREAFTAAALQEQTERRAQAEQSLLEAQKFETLAVVTGGVAHDFNNLLAVVTASLHLHTRRHPELAAEKQVQAMTRAIQSGVRLTRQLLSFTRKQALRPESVALQSWLPATEGLFRSTLGSTIAWQLTVEADTLPVLVDLGELELALLNLVVNARHAMPSGGALQLHAANDRATAGSARPMVGLAVIDTGVGIPAELLGKVIEPFFTTRARGVGSGLGLSQVQGFCAEAGGSLQIESRVDEGTTVRMLLPASPQAVAAEPVRTTETRSLQGRVLLVEDNEDVGAATELVLHAAGLDVVRSLNADDALLRLEAAATLPDVVLSDIAMPGSMNGIELAFTLMKRFPALPVLLTTGYAEQLDLAVAGGLRVLQKPVAPEDLLTELRQLLNAQDAADTRTAPV